MPIDVPILSLPVVDCTHATATTARSNSVACALGCFGGEPHVSMCRVCPKRVGRASNTTLTEIKAASRPEAARALARGMVCQRCLYFKGGDLDGEAGTYQVRCERSRTGPVVNLVNGECRADRWSYCESPETAATYLARVGLRKFSPPVRLQDFFGWVFVISLKRTPGRLAQFWENFPRDWPFKTPVVFEAIDADNEHPWDGWQGGGGAFGCWRSWLSILSSCLAELPKLAPGRRQAILVMEDDCEFIEGGMERLVDFVRRLPEDWEIAFPGGQHFQTPAMVSPGIVRCKETGRTHCVMVKASFAAQLYQFWLGWNTHIDHGLQHWCRLTPERRFYAADPFCAIQRANWSTIRWRQEPARSWDNRVRVPRREAAEIPIVVCRSPLQEIESLRSRGLVHTGYWRDDRGVDRGLIELMAKPSGERPSLLREWIELVREEAAAFPEARLAIWWPDGYEEIVRLLVELGIDFTEQDEARPVISV